MLAGCTEEAGICHGSAFSQPAASASRRSWAGSTPRVSLPASSRSGAKPVTAPSLTDGLCSAIGH